VTNITDVTYLSQYFLLCLNYISYRCNCTQDTQLHKLIGAPVCVLGRSQPMATTLQFFASILDCLSLRKRHQL